MEDTSESPDIRLLIDGTVEHLWCHILHRSSLPFVLQHADTEITNLQHTIILQVQVLRFDIAMYNRSVPNFLTLQRLLQLCVVILCQVVVFCFEVDPTKLMRFANSFECLRETGQDHVLGENASA